MTQTNKQLSAEIYDDVVHDWPGEIDFYRQAIKETKSNRVLEVACGTGRVLLRIVGEGVQATGIDLSPEMLDVARKKGAGKPNISFFDASMKSFNLHQIFQLAIVPGHSFQFMLTPEEQIESLESIKRHLAPGGTLVVHLDHQDIAWLGDLCKDSGGVFHVETEVSHPETGNKIRVSKAWDYEPSTQTASAVTRQEELDSNGEVIHCTDSEPTRLHCIFRFEMEHLLRSVGFNIENVYGDFFRQPLDNDSSEMIWVAKMGA